MADDGRWNPRSEHERKLLDVVRHREHTYNNDVEKLVLEDRGYLDPSQWPGIVAAAPFATPGGLRAPR